MEGDREMKGLSEYDQHYFKSVLNKILVEFIDSFLNYGKDELRYTHSFDYVDSSLSGKSNRPFLRKCLRTLEERGLVKNFDAGFNTHKWQITEKGKAEAQKILDELRGVKSLTP